MLSTVVPITKPVAIGKWRAKLKHKNKAQLVSLYSLNLFDGDDRRHPCLFKQHVYNEYTNATGRKQLRQILIVLLVLVLV